MDINEKKDGLLPSEWMALVKEAMDSNITKDQFKEFLKQKSQEKNILNIKKTIRIYILMVFYYCFFFCEKSLILFLDKLNCFASFLFNKLDFI